MRIISGSFKGRKIRPPAKMLHTRPTTDVAREGLFNILNNNFDISTLETLDLFGGTGAISFEFASRGAKGQTVVESDGNLVAFIKSTIEMLHIESMQVFKMDVFNYLSSCTSAYDLVFADPPYAMAGTEQLPDIIFSRHLVRKGGWFVMEHTTDKDFSKHLKFKAERKYGSTIFSIFIED